MEVPILATAIGGRITFFSAAASTFWLAGQAKLGLFSRQSSTKK